MPLVWDCSRCHLSIPRGWVAAAGPLCLSLPIPCCQPGFPPISWEWLSLCFGNSTSWGMTCRVFEQVSPSKAWATSGSMRPAATGTMPGSPELWGLLLGWGCSGVLSLHTQLLGSLG